MQGRTEVIEGEGRNNRMMRSALSSYHIELHFPELYSFSHIGTHKKLIRGMHNIKNLIPLSACNHRWL